MCLEWMLLGVVVLLEVDCSVAGDSYGRRDVPTHEREKTVD